MMLVLPAYSITALTLLACFLPVPKSLSHSLMSIQDIYNQKGFFFSISFISALIFFSAKSTFRTFQYSCHN